MKQHWRLPSRCTPPRCLYAAGTVPATPTQTPHPFPTYSLPSRAADSPPHTSTAPLHTAPIPPDSATRPALALPTLVPCRTLHHPSLRNRHTFDAYPLRSSRSTTPPTPLPPSTPPALSPSGQTQIDHAATVPAHDTPPAQHFPSLHLLCAYRRRFIARLLHTMLDMSGTMQFSRE